MVPNQENMEGDQPIQSHSHAQQLLQPQTCVQEHYPAETGLPSPDRFEYYFSKYWIIYSVIQCGFILKVTMQLVLGKVEFNACQVPLLWYNSFLVSLWTFQPTLVQKTCYPHVQPLEFVSVLFNRWLDFASRIIKLIRISWKISVHFRGQYIWLLPALYAIRMFVQRLNKANVLS